jgi:hypothetical protein
MTVITMSRKEQMRLRVLIDIGDGRLSVADATGLLGVGRRQVYRLLDAFRACGPDGLGPNPHSAPAGCRRSRRRASAPRSTRSTAVPKLRISGISAGPTISRSMRSPLFWRGMSPPCRPPSNAQWRSGTTRRSQSGAFPPISEGASIIRPRRRRDRGTRRNLPLAGACSRR